MIVETKIVGQPTELTDVQTALPPGPATLRAVLEELVRAELVQHQKRREERAMLRVLTPADLARGFDAGSFRAEPRKTPRAPSADVAIARAVEAFGDGLYFVFHDSVQIESLEEVLELTPDSRLRLVRLVALAGG